MCDGVGTLYVPATSWCAMHGFKQVAAISCRFNNPISRKTRLSLFCPPSLLANDKYFNFFPSENKGGAGCAPLGSATAARLVCQQPSSNFPYFRTPLANFLLSRPNSVEYDNCKTTTLLPSAKCTRPLFQGRTGCGGHPSGWHDIVTCQRLVRI